MKYISAYVGCNEYWCAVYNIGKFKTDDAKEIEMFISDDKEGDKLYFALDLYNLPCLEELIANDDWYDGEEKSKPEYASFLQYYQDLKDGKVDYFIYRLFFEDELTLNDCELNGKTVFEARTKKRSPFCGKIFINETGGLTPEKIIEWMGKLSAPLFGEQFEFQFTDIPDRDSMLEWNKEVYPDCWQCHRCGDHSDGNMP